MRRRFKHLREKLLQRRKEEAAPLQNGKARALGFSLAIFEQARDHMHLHRTLAGNRGGTLAFDMIRETLSEMVRGELGAAGKNAKDAIPRELIVQYLVGAYMAVLTWWLDGGAKLPPHRINAMFERLATEGIFDLRR